MTLRAVLGAIHGSRPAPPPPEPWRVPVPSPRFACPVHDTAWNGAGGCWICSAQPSQLEEPS